MSLYTEPLILIKSASDIGRLIQGQYLVDPDRTEAAISPISILLCSILAYVGMAGKTKKQFDQAVLLRFGVRTSPFVEGSSDTYSMLTDAMNYIKSILNRNTGGLELKLSNRAYLHNAVTPLDNFVQLLKSMGSLESMDLSNTDAACQIINNRISDDTNSNIKDLLKPDMLEDAVLVLVNALYFEAKWLYEFEQRGLSQSMLFTKHDGSQINTLCLSYKPGMGHEPMNVFENEIAKAVSIPFKVQDYAMMLVVPKNADALNALDITVSDYIDAITDSAEAQYCAITIPKWTQRTNTELKHIFERLGMTDMFQEGVANFDLIMQDSQKRRICVSNIVHEAFVEVSKDGVKAAAATVMVMRAECASYPPTPTFELKADRTFGWAIYHVPTKMILFQGVYDGSIDQKIENEMGEEYAQMMEYNRKMPSRVGDLTECAGPDNKASYEQKWYEAMGEIGMRKYYCSFCRSNNCSNKRYIPEPIWISDLKESDYLISCACKSCVISPADRARAEQEALANRIREGVLRQKAYLSKCFGKIHKPITSYTDADNKKRYVSWYVERGVSYVNASYCEYCVKHCTGDGMSQKVFEPITQADCAFLNNRSGTMMCDCPNCE